MPVKHKPGKSKTITRHTHKKHTSLAKPLAPRPLPVVPDLPLPMPEKPTQVAPPPVLIKTTYNRRRFWQVGSSVAVCILIGLAYLAYTQRSYWLAIIRPTLSTTSVHHLQVASEKIDSAKAQAILQQTRQTQASSSANLHPTPTSNPANSSNLQVPSTATLATYSSNQLQTLLEQQITQLQGEKQDVRTLQSYLSRAHNQPDQAVTILKEGVQLAKEFQTLYLYYK